MLGVFVSLIPPALLLLWPFLERSPERHPKKRPIAVAIGIAAIALVVFFGVIGYVSESDMTIAGKKYHFDLYGIPHAAERGSGS